MNVEIEWFQDQNKERGENQGGLTFWATPTVGMGKNEWEGAKWWKKGRSQDRTVQETSKGEKEFWKEVDQLYQVHMRVKENGAGVYCCIYA